MNPWVYYVILLDYLILNNSVLLGYSRRHRSVVYNHHLKVDLEGNAIEGEVGSSPDLIWYTQTVAAGDTAVLHCSFDAIFAQLRNGNIDWAREKSSKDAEAGPLALAEGKKVLIDDRRYRVYRPHNSALSVLIIRRAKKRDAGIYRCNLAGSLTRHKYMALNVTESKIDAHTSPPKLKTRVGNDVTMWCNASGYPTPVVYWTREDNNRKLQDGTYQYWGSGLHLYGPTEEDTGIYACYLDNFVQPVVSYKFSVSVEDSPWVVDGYKMRFDSTEWFPVDSTDPAPVRGKSYLLMCETKGSPQPIPKITWQRDGKTINNNKKHFYIIEDQPDWRTGGVRSTLVIIRFVPRFQGSYTCTGTNVFRTKSQTFTIDRYVEKADTVNNPPGKASNISVKPLANLLDVKLDFSNGNSARYDTDSTTEVTPSEAPEEETEEAIIDASDDEDLTDNEPSGVEDDALDQVEYRA